jgi:hypothetical protein
MLGAAVLLVSLAPTAHAIDEGVPDGNRHPNVGILGVDEDGNGPKAAQLLCNGAVISDRHFLTAAHCTALIAPGAEAVVTLQAGSVAAPVCRPRNLSRRLSLPTDRSGDSAWGDDQAS